MSPRLLGRLEHHTPSVDVLPGIDGVRALAVLLVFGFHTHAFAGASDLSVLSIIDLTPWLDRGFLGAQLFFVLSGFLLMLPWARAYYYRESRASIGHFLRRRLLRIVPAYYVHLAVLFLALVPVVHSYHFLLSPEGRWNVLAHLSFAQFFFPSTATGVGINGALWTLSIEAQFYLVLPLMAGIFVGRRMFIGLALALIVSMLWRYLCSHQLLDIALRFFSDRHATFYEPTTAAPEGFSPFLVQMFLLNQFPAQVFHFAAGMAAASLYTWLRAVDHRRLMEGSRGTVFATVSALGFLYVAGSFPLFSPASWNTGLWYILDALVNASLVLACAYPNLISLKVLGNRWLRAIGVTSYGVYLWHVPVLFLVSHFLVPRGMDPLDAFYEIAVVAGLASLTIAYLSYLHVEKAFLHRRLSLKPELRAPRLSGDLGYARSAAAAGRD